MWARSSCNLSSHEVIHIDHTAHVFEKFDRAKFTARSRLQVVNVYRMNCYVRWEYRQPSLNK